MEVTLWILQVLILQHVLHFVTSFRGLQLQISQDCQPGFEKVRGSCQPCQPQHFKDRSMIGEPCKKCDYVKNSYQEQYCPCTSTQNAVIVCRNDSIEVPELYCKRRSEVRKLCVQQEELQLPRTKVEVSALVTTASHQDVRHDRSSIRAAQYPVTTVNPSSEVDLRHTEFSSSKSLEALLIVGSIVFVIVALIVIYLIRRLIRGCRRTGERQAHAAAKNQEQALQFLTARSDDGSSFASGDGLPHHLRLQIVQEREGPQSIHGSVLDLPVDHLSALSDRSSNLFTSRNDQLEYENSVAPLTNPDSDRRPISLGLSVGRS